MRATQARPGRHLLALACSLTLIGGCTTQTGPSNGPSVGVTPAQTGLAASSPPISAPTSPGSDGFPILPGSRHAELEGDISCSGSIDPADPVAIVRLVGSTDEAGPTVIQDYADPAAPRTVCTFTGFRSGVVRFVDARHLLASPVDSPGLYFVVDLPEVRYHWIQLPVAADTSFPPDLVAISPALDRLVWVSRDPEARASDAVHVTTAAGDLLVTQLRDTNAGRCGDEDDSDLGAYARTGSLAYLLNRPSPADASLIVTDGEQVTYSVLAPDSGWPAGGGPAMAVWSPTTETLYFRNGADAWSWSAADGVNRLLPGIRWYRPAISPDGTYLAYTVLGAGGLPDVYLVDLANPGDPMHIGTGHGNLPAFLSNDQLWYEAMQYTPGCEGAEIMTPFVHSFTDGSETPSMIDSVIATWPSTGSNH